MVRFLSAVRDRSGPASQQLAITVAKVLKKKTHLSGCKCHLVIRGRQACSNGWGGKELCVLHERCEFLMARKKKQSFYFCMISSPKLRNIPYLLNKFRILVKLNQSTCQRTGLQWRLQEKKGVSCGMRRRTIDYCESMASLSGDFLAMQLIYGGKSANSIPKVNFPYSFSFKRQSKIFFQ